MEDSQIIPIVSIIGGFSLGGFFWWMVIRAQVRARELLHIERQAAIARGLPPPDEPPERPAESGGGLVKAAPEASGKELGTGLFWLLIGLGMIVALRIVNPASTSWGWGVIPVALGLAYLVGFALSSWLARRSRRDDPPLQDGSHR